MPDTVSDIFNVRCPDCGSDSALMVVITVLAHLSPDGTDPDDDHHWDDESNCICGACDRIGTVKDFRINNEENRNAAD